MATNTSDVNTNVTLDQVIDYFNLNKSEVNQSEVTQIHLFDLYEAYRTIEKEQLMVYQFVAYIIGTLIILSNLTVVISSGLILRKGQQPKSTYLLLGNVSLADTIIGFGLIFGVTVDNSVSSNPLCIFQIGMLVCPAMVSIFSVGLIAVDRYIYILHGLYYQRWFNTTRVRIGIIIIWMIGIILGFMPATGWVNSELILTRCYYVALFPGALILLNSVLSIIPIAVVAVLYSKILIQALKTVKTINRGVRNTTVDKTTPDKSQMRIYRGSKTDLSISTQSVKIPKKTPSPNLARSASFHDSNKTEVEIAEQPTSSYKSKSIANLVENDDVTTNDNNISMENISRASYGSIISVYTIEANGFDSNITMAGQKSSRFSNQVKKVCNINKIIRKPNEPNKWRAITIVLLTSGSIIFTWTPFFITVIFFVFCEDKMTNDRCLHIRHLLGGPFPTLAFLNSVLNPLIYAWWHKGFQESIITCYRKYVRKFNCWIYRYIVSMLPAMGWTGRSFRDFRCWYIAVFPSALLLVLSIVVLSVIIMVCLLYILILRSAVKTVDKIRVFKENSHTNKGFIDETSSSTTVVSVSEYCDSIKMNKIEQESNYSGIIMEGRRSGCCWARSDNHPSKLKAVKTVLIVTLCFLCTWAPYFVSVIMYVKCDIMKNGYECVPLEVLTIGPLYLLGCCNSLCDPLIYAWRHSGFKRSLKRLYRKYIRKLEM